jgi:effector-binding domain-containing protein
MSAFMSEAFGKIDAAMKKSKAKCMGQTVGIYYTWDAKTMSSDMVAGMPVNKNITTDEIQTIEIPADTACLIDYYGPFSGSEFAHTAMDLYFKKNHLKTKMPVIEEYWSDPATEPDSTKWLTKIYYFAE